VSPWQFFATYATIFLEISTTEQSDIFSVCRTTNLTNDERTMQLSYNTFITLVMKLASQHSRLRTGRRSARRPITL